MPLEKEVVITRNQDRTFFFHSFNDWWKWGHHAHSEGYEGNLEAPITPWVTKVDLDTTATW